MVSASSATGIKRGFSADQISYFKRIKEMNMTNPRLIGFGISDSGSFAEACRSADVYQNDQCWISAVLYKFGQEPKPVN